MSTMTLERKEDGLWLHVSKGTQHGMLFLGNGLRADGKEVLAVQLLRDALEAVLPMLASARVPEGWQLVPVEPTYPMICAAHRATDAGCMDTGIWKAMLASAPKRGEG